MQPLPRPMARLQPLQLPFPNPLFGGAPLPKLKHLVLDGVHVHWGMLAQSLRATEALESLNIENHSKSVWMSREEFAHILWNAKGTLKRIELSASMFRMPVASQNTVSSHHSSVYLG